MDDLVLEFEGHPVDVLALMRHIREHPAAVHYSPWFHTYYADLAGREYMSKYVRFLRQLLAMRPGGVAGQCVLDAGCGFGIMAVLMALLGARRVDGLDCHQGMIETFRTYLDILPMRLPVQAHLGDVARLPFEAATFDLVLCNEALSHYPDPDAFYAEAWRVLRPGGALLISDSNNARNPGVRRATRELWLAFEQGPAGVVVQGHRIERPFVDQRREIIAQAYPTLSVNAAQLLAQHTSGLSGQRLLDAAQGYLDTGVLPDHVYRPDQCPLDPVQGFYIENLLDPVALRAQLQRMGFQTRLRTYFGGARGGPLSLANAVLTWAPLTPLMLPWAPSFRILATKPAN